MYHAILILLHLKQIMNIIEDENTADHIISQIAACTYAESYQTKN